MLRWSNGNVIKRIIKGSASALHNVKPEATNFFYPRELLSSKRTYTNAWFIMTLVYGIRIEQSKNLGIFL